MQQLHKDQLSLDQVEVLNTFCEEKVESSLLFTLEEVYTADVVNETAAITEIGDEMDRVFGY